MQIRWDFFIMREREVIRLKDKVDFNKVFQVKYKRSNDMYITISLVSKVLLTRKQTLNLIILGRFKGILDFLTDMLFKHSCVSAGSIP